MGIDYHSGLAVGFRIHAEELIKCFKPEGTEVGDDDDGQDLMFEGEKVDMYELVDQLADYAECSYSTNGNYYDSGYDNMEYVFGPPLEKVKSTDMGRMTFDEVELELADFVGLKAECDRIEKVLRQLGLNPGKPVVTATMTIS